MCSRVLELSARVVLSVLVLIAGAVCFGQTKDVADATCAGLNVEDLHFVVRSSKIEDPFSFLPWVRAREKRAAARVSTLVDNKPFTFAAVRDAALKIIEEENFLPDARDARVRVRLEFVTIKNCSNQKLDVVYRIYSTQIMPVLSGVPESRVTERQTPQDAAGMEKVNASGVRPFRFTPLASYDSTDKLAPGARLDITGKDSNAGVLSSASIEGRASSQMQEVSASVAGARDLDEGRLGHVEWRFNFNNHSLPTGAGDLEGGDLSGQFLASLKPSGSENFLIRLGGLINGGHQQTDITDVKLAPNTVANTSFGTAKFYAGIDSRLRRHVFSATYGLELGATDKNIRVDWVKHLFDFRHEFWGSRGDHHTIDVESRLTAGKLDVRRVVPVAERFFGGNHEDFLIPNDSWEIRANPVIRAIPGKRFFRTPAGDGGDSFFSYNLTAAYAIWREPLVPSDLAKTDKFNELLEAQLTNAQSFEQLHFLTKDEHYLKLLDLVTKPQPNPTVQAALDSLSAAVSAAQTSHPGQFPDLFENCVDDIRDASSRASSANQKKGEEQYGFVMSLLSSDDDELGSVITDCVQTLNGSGGLAGNAAMTAAGNNLVQLKANMESELAKIDEAAAEKKAAADMVFVRRTLHTLVYDANVFSVSPVLVFDVARLGHRNGTLGGTRYGPGTGLRLELASSAQFTAGYAWNTRRAPGEGHGTFFFSIGIRDLFR